MHQNAWKTQWKENGKLLYRQFEGDRPTSAVDFGKELKARGIVVVEVISVRKAFPPPPKNRVPPKIGMLWCPYCVKWREFHEAEVVRPEYTTPVLLRCTVCTISVRDAYVRMYNPELVLKWEVQQELKQKQREINKQKKKMLTPRGSLKSYRR